jgi:hypothetical protein
MIKQNPIQITAGGFNPAPLAMVSSAGSPIDSPARERVAQHDHAHWYGVPATNAVTARAGGGQALATVLAAAINRITTVATAADSVAFPASVAGDWRVVINSGTNNLQLFGTGTDTINGAASGTGVSVAAGARFLAFCPIAGQWFGGVLS